MRLLLSLGKQSHLLIRYTLYRLPTEDLGLMVHTVLLSWGTFDTNVWKKLFAPSFSFF